MNIKKSAKKIKRQIIEYYAAVNLQMELDFDRAVGDLIVFQIGFKPGTTENKIRSYLKDVQQTLGLQLFQLHREGMQLFFVASEHNNFDNRLLGVLTSPSYPEYLKANNIQMPYVIGFDVMRKPVIVDLPLYNYWLLGGAGCTGKTVGMRSFITSLMWSCSPEQLNLIIIDEPAELVQFSKLPHLSCPVIHDMNAGYKAIMKVYAEMKRRQKLKVENPEEYRRLPILVCFIDECVSLVTGAGNKQKSQQLAGVISLLLRMGRHAKIYPVLATQNPALNEMGCDLNPIKSRIAFTCAKPHNSVTILGEGGAEKLNGNGELYFQSQRHPGLMYVKGAFIDAESGEIDMVCDHIRAKYETTEWDDRYKFVIDAESLQPDAENAGDTQSFGSTTTQENDDKTLAKIIMWTLGRKIVSANAIYNAFKPEVGERKAKRFLERLQKLGIAGDATAKKACKVLPTSIDDLSTDIIDLLDQAGHSVESIGKAFKNDNPNISDEEAGDDFENDNEGEEG